VSRFGTAFIAATEVKARHESRPVDEQIAAYVAALGPRDTKARLKLAAWMKEIGREEEALALAGEILDLDPENAGAHEFLGHLRYRGRWVTFEEKQRAEGLEQHGDRWYTPQEWANLAEGAKRAAAAEDEAAAHRRLNDELNAAARLAVSPDPLVRARGRARIEALAEEHDSDRLRKAIEALDAYVERLGDLRRKAAAAAVAGHAGGGLVMGEIRATLTRLKRPIQILETSLASGPFGANAPVKIQLPELEVIRVRTTAMFPATVDDDGP
jgi:tetratricopeptide (TPR) repeat protein